MMDMEAEELKRHKRAVEALQLDLQIAFSDMITPEASVLVEAVLA